MKRFLTISMMLFMISGLVACGSSQAAQMGNKIPFATDTLKLEEETDSKVLIAYFSRVGNTQFPDDVDAIASASLVMKNDAIYGNTQYLATLLQQATGGDLFSILVSDKYPVDYDSTVDRAETENRDQIRPALFSKVDSITDYDIIFLGFPNWWYDMPMPVYSFLDEYDLSEKTIIPFGTSGGSGFSNTISEIQALEPDATVITDGFTVSHFNIEESTFEEVDAWVKGLQISLQ